MPSDKRCDARGSAVLGQEFDFNDPSKSLAHRIFYDFMIFSVVDRTLANDIYTYTNDITLAIKISIQVRNFCTGLW